MKKIFFTIVFLSLFRVNAQDSTYSKVFFDNTIEMETYAADNTLDSGYVIVGMNAGNEALIIRLDSLSNVVWSRSLDGASGQQMFTDVIATKDSTFVAVGMDNQQAYCVKFNLLGDTLWTRTYGASYSDGTYITESYDSNYVFTWGTYQDTKTNVVKIDTDGNLMWSSQFNIASASVPKVIEQLKDSTLYIGGAISWNSGMIIKLNESGQIIWSKEFDAGQVHDLEFLGDSIFALCANFNFSSGAVMKMDTAANISWYNLYPSYIDGSGNFLNIRGYLNEDSTLIFSVPSMMVGSNTLNRIDVYGNLEQSMGANIGSTAILPTINHGSFITGNGPVYGIKKVWIPHIGIIRTDSLLVEPNNWCMSVGWGNTVTPLVPSVTDLFYTNSGGVPEIQSVVSEVGYTYQWELNCVDFIGSVDEYDLELGVSVYPNASSGIFNLEFDSQGFVDVIIVDQLGRTIYSKTTNSSNLLIDLSEQKSGVYHYKVSEAKSGRAGTGKLILLK